MSATAVAGPAVIDQLERLTAAVSIDRNTLSHKGTHDMRYSMAEAIAHVTQGEYLYPGALLSTDTLPGGCGMTLGRWLTLSDELRLEIDGTGVIEHQIHKEGHARGDRPAFRLRSGRPELTSTPPSRTTARVSPSSTPDTPQTPMMCSTHYSRLDTSSPISQQSCSRTPI
jgi:hypothetical protein